MAKGSSTKKRVKDSLWLGFGFGVGAAVFVPLINMGLKKIGVSL